MAAALRPRPRRCWGLADRGFCLSGGTGMTGTWGRILAQYGQSVTLRRGRRNRTARRFSSRCGSGGRTGTRSCPLRWGRRGGISGSTWGRQSFPGGNERPVRGVERAALCGAGGPARLRGGGDAVLVGPAGGGGRRGADRADVRGKTLGFSGGTGADGGVPETAGGGRGVRLPGGAAATERAGGRRIPAGLSGRAGRLSEPGERYDESTGRWQEYGRRETLTFGLDLYGRERGELQRPTTEWRRPSSGGPRRAGAAGALLRGDGI